MRAPSVSVRIDFWANAISPQTPCERLLQADSIPVAAKETLREISAELDPLKLLEEMRAVQAYLAALADGETPPQLTSDPPGVWLRRRRSDGSHRRATRLRDLPRTRNRLGRSTSSLVVRRSRRCAWCGRSHAADWKDFRTSPHCNSSKSSVFSSPADLPASSTKRCCGALIAGAKTLVPAVSLSDQRRIDVSATNLAAADPSSSKTTGRKW